MPASADPRAVERNRSAQMQPPDCDLCLDQLFGIVALAIRITAIRALQWHNFDLASSGKHSGLNHLQVIRHRENSWYAVGPDTRGVLIGLVINHSCEGDMPIFYDDAYRLLNA